MITEVLSNTTGNYSYTKGFNSHAELLWLMTFSWNLFSR